LKNNGGRRKFEKEGEPKYEKSLNNSPEKAQY
jgi:hypothetical protein